MEFISHTIARCKGGIFDGRMFCPFAKAMFIPLFVVGVLCMTTGLSMNFSNQKSIAEYQKAYSESPRQTMESEKGRTEAFIKWCPYTMYGISLLIGVGICLFLFLPTPRGRAMGLSLILLGFAILFLDHFSEERAGVYHQQIVRYLK